MKKKSKRMLALQKEGSLNEKKYTLIHEVKITYRETIRMLIQIVEERDPYTMGHSENVTKYALMMARELQFTGQMKDELKETALLHDIGKIGIPENILNKPGRLDDDEFGIIKGHPKKGFNILGPLLEQLLCYVHISSPCRIDQHGFLRAAAKRRQGDAGQEQK